MRIVDIQSCRVTVEFSPEDCQRITTALSQIDYMPGDDRHDSPGTSFDWLESYASAFEAAALAAAMGTKIDGTATLEAMRSGELLSPLWGNLPATS
jgi:hypothetical protein